MGKFIGAIVGAVLTGVGILTGNPALVAAGVSMFASTTLTLLFGPKAPKPQASETQVKSPTAPRIKGYGVRRVYGSMAFFGTATDGSAVDVIAYVDCKANSVDRVYLNDDQVTISSGIVQPLGDGAYGQSKVLAGYTLGAATETAHAAVVSKLPSIWTSAHRGDGVVSGYLIKQPVKQKDFLEVYPQGDAVEMSLVINMQPCFDPREVSHNIGNPATWAETHNPVLHLLHYFVFEQGYDYDTRILPQIDKWIAAADVCDEVISGEARYRSCVLYDKTAKPKEVIGSLLETFDGWYAVNSENEIEIYAGEYYTPTVTINSSHIVDYSVQSFVEDENKVNEVSIKYISAEHDYNEVEAQPWRLEDDISERGRIVNRGIAPQVPSFKQARRLAKIFVARENAAARGTISTNYAGRIAEGQRFVNLEIIEAGATIFDGPAEIVAVTRNLETGGITFDWRSVDPNAWAWNTSTEDGYGAPVGTFPTLDTLDAPSITDATAEFYVDASFARITLDISGPDRDDLTWFLRWKVAADSIWNEAQYSDIDAGASVALLSGPVPLNSMIDLQAAYAIGSGQVSPWSATETVDTDTTSIAPATPTQVSATGAAGSATINWRASLSSNFVYSKVYRNTSNSFGGATVAFDDVLSGIGELVSRTDTLAAGTYYFWVTSANAIDVESSPVATGAVTVT